MKKTWLFVLSAILLFVVGTKSSVAESTVHLSPLNPSTEILSIDKARAGQILATVPHNAYVEETYRNGRWEQTYQKVFSWTTIRFANNYRRYSNPYDETVWYNSDGTYNRRSYYTTYMYSTW
ncbi:hypothetical protein P7H41_11860 [Vagococcus fluvialis]|uniref:hypothetical protein n=1 Tax=Vagococcus fluvialis TaxID=2738 RepID=UPI00288DF505|nr:hypothetical protein [Vagococcus fluvialis]MDT2782650.1 hypothetical protein [Vagococcus fluvialis]